MQCGLKRVKGLKKKKPDLQTMIEILFSNRKKFPSPRKGHVAFI